MTPRRISRHLDDFRLALLQAELDAGEEIDEVEDDVTEDGDCSEHIADWYRHTALEDDIERDKWDDDGGFFPNFIPPSIGLFGGGDEEDEGAGDEDEDGGDEEKFESSFAIEWAPVKQSPEDTRYNSVAEFLDDLNGKARHPASQALKDAWVHGDCPSFGYGGGRPHDYLGHLRTGDQVQATVKAGWPEGIERARRLLEGFDTEDMVAIDRRRRLQRADFGDHLDISAVYSGHHSTAWTKGKRKRAISPSRIDIVANMVTVYSDSGDVLFWRGAAVMALSDLLENAGYSVRLTYGTGSLIRDSESFSSGRQCKASLRIAFKDYGQPLDVATASALLLPGFARALGIGWDVLVAPFPMTRGTGCGCFVGTVHTESGEYLCSHEVDDERSARKWIQATLDKINASD